VRLPLEQLARQLHHDFHSPNLLGLALSHRSSGGAHNERLEFLGDSILGFIMAEILYRRFPQADEGQLSRLRATLVRRDTLAEVARGFDLPRYLQMGAGELNSGGQNRSSTLADTLEAVLAAVYLDAGLDTAVALVERLFAKPIADLSLESVNKDPKTRLQELMQAQGRPLPLYQVIEVSGEQHNQLFQIACLLEDGVQRVVGLGSSRRRAEQAAAAAMLEQLTHG
jgi:ribonuclease III